MIKNRAIIRSIRSVFAPVSPALFLVCTLLTGTVVAGETDCPRIALIIDDLGNSRAQAERALSLPGPIALAVLPRTPYAAWLARDARLSGKDVLLHLPMQAADDSKPLGPGAITLDTTQEELAKILAENLATVPGVVGISSHMGSLITRHPGHMAWLMESISKYGPLLFVDSYTTTSSVAIEIARKYEIPATRRDVFLDRAVDRAAVHAQFERLLEQAREKGTALAIGHPYPVTISVLEERVPALGKEGVELVGIKELIRIQAGGKATWQAYSSR